MTKKTVLTIAGSDSSGGAGIQADIKVISALGSYAASVITALTAQNTLGVQAVYEIPAGFVGQQLESVFSDLTIEAVKIGMLVNAEIIQAIAASLKKYQPKFIVLDPVMISKSGCELVSSQAITALKENLFPLVNLITPNIFEAEKLLDIKIENKRAQELAAKNLAEKFKLNVLVKGGHISGEHSSDVLYTKNKSFWFDAPRIDSKNTHGTGCSLSAAIATYLAQGFELHAAILHAKNYITRAIAAGRYLKVGQGCGPLGHFCFSV